MKKPNRKEMLFCLYYIQDRNGRAAAANAGYTDPAQAAVRLLKRPEIRRAIAENAPAPSADPAEILAGYRKLAFGSGADALKLLFDSVPPDAFDTLDLFNVAEIKRPKDGALEIKFFDRLKALEHLQQFSETDQTDPALPLYRALMRSVPQPGKDTGGDALCPYPISDDFPPSN